MKQIRRGAPDGAMSENPVSRDSQRVPLETRVQLKFEWFGGFISEYSANISPGGMFIRTQTPGWATTTSSSGEPERWSGRG
jgi:hypothetical protein